MSDRVASTGKERMNGRMNECGGLSSDLWLAGSGDRNRGEERKRRVRG